MSSNIIFLVYDQTHTLQLISGIAYTNIIIINISHNLNTKHNNINSEENM